MTTPYILIHSLGESVQVPDDGILSKSLLNVDRAKVVLFAFAPGQELSEHTASVPAILHVLEGEGTLTLGAHAVEARPGTWVHLPANLPHGIQARTPLKMLLVMLKTTTERPDTAHQETLMSPQ